MLPHKNRTIAIKTLVASGEKRTFSTVATGVRVYINQNGEELIDGFDGEGAIFAHKMLTDGNHAAIAIGHRITDDTGKQYDVRGKAVSKDLTGTHHQYLLVEAYD